MAENSLSKLAEIYGWPTDMPPEARDLMHALGVAQYRFVHLEFAFDWLFATYLNHGPVVGRAITENLGNVSKVHALKIIVADMEKDSAVREHVDYAFRCFDILREGRNTITHAMMMFFEASEAADGKKTFTYSPQMTKVKAKGEFGFTQWPISVKTIRQLADETQEIDRFFRRMVLYVALRRNPRPPPEPPPALPKKPPQPRKLLTLLEKDQQSAKPPPKSSRGKRKHEKP